MTNITIWRCLNLFLPHKRDAEACTMGTKKKLIYFIQKLLSQQKVAERTEKR